MQYRVRIGTKTSEIAVTPIDDGGNTQLTCNGETRSAGVQMIAPHHLRLDLEGRGVNIYAVRSKEGVWIWADGHAFLAQPVPERRAGARPGAPGLGPTVTPPMPAVVVEVLVELGQHVGQGEALVVVSAMKMEMTLVAPHSGRVLAIHAGVGAKVNPGDVLVDIEAEEKTDG